jgi:hypothetical protein
MLPLRQWRLFYNLLNCRDVTVNSLSNAGSFSLPQWQKDGFHKTGANMDDMQIDSRRICGRRVSVQLLCSINAALRG